MWYTTRTEGFDTAVHKNRAPFLHEYISQKINASLRMAFGQRLISMIGLFISYYAFKGKTLFAYDMSSTSEEMRSNPNYLLNNCIWQGLGVLSVMYFACYHFCLADDAAWARGYRAGSKFLGAAIMLDAIVQMSQLSSYIWLYKHYSEQWWIHNFGSGGIEWLFISGSRILSGMALTLYAFAFFLLEVYHDEGTNEWHAVFNLFLFSVAGFAEMFSACFVPPGVAFLLVFIAVVSGFLWSLPFEEELTEASALHETELVNQVEEETNKYAALSPYVKTTH